MMIETMQKKVGHRLQFPVSRRLFLNERATNSRATGKDELFRIGGRYFVKVSNEHMLEGYAPPVVDYDYLAGIMSPDRLRLINKNTLAVLASASAKFQKHFEAQGPPLLRRAGEMFPWREVDMSLEEQAQGFPLHSNTAECTRKALVYKLDPVQSVEGCDMACIYCLVGRQHALDEQGQSRNDTVWTVSETLVKKDYDQYVAEELERIYLHNKQVAEKGRAVVLDLGPATDFFSAAMLESGMAHRILLALIRYFERHPDDSMQVLVYTKAGMGDMMVPGPGGEPPILTLLLSKELCAPRGIVVGSVASMSSEMREVLEPGAPVLEDRVNLYEILCCNKLLRTVLYQPLIPGVYDDKIVKADLKILAEIGIEQVKFQMLACDEATAATIGPLIDTFWGMEAGKTFWNSLAWDIPESDKKGSRRYPVEAELTVNELIRYRHMAESMGLYVSFCRYDIKHCAEVKLHSELAVEEGIRTMGGVSNVAVESETGYTCVGYRLKPLVYEELNKNNFTVNIDVRKKDRLK